MLKYFSDAEIRRRCQDAGLKSTGSNAGDIAELEKFYQRRRLDRLDAFGEFEVDKNLFLFFDIGTVMPINKPKYGYYDPMDFAAYGMNSRIRSIAYGAFDIEKGKMVVFEEMKSDSLYTTIKGFDRNKLVDDRKVKINMLRMFGRLVRMCSAVCGHNIEFDVNVLLAEAHRMGCPELLEDLVQAKKICTWEMARKTSPFKEFERRGLSVLYAHVQDVMEKSDVIDDLSDEEQKKWARVRYMEPKFHVSLTDMFACFCIYIFMKYGGSMKPTIARAIIDTIDKEMIAYLSKVDEEN